jgi:hypothetical protein
VIDIPADPDDGALRRRLLLRRGLVLGLAAYGVVCLRAPERFRFLDALNLGIHETGHLVFTPFGEGMHFLGGTLLQVGFPLLFVVHFLRRGDRFAAYVVCWWVAQNLWNVSVYVADARAQLLPLVGGGEHDWNYLLGRAGWLRHDLLLARLVHLGGTLLFAWAMFQAWHHAADGATEGRGNRSRSGAVSEAVTARLPPFREARQAEQGSVRAGTTSSTSRSVSPSSSIRVA